MARMGAKITVLKKLHMTDVIEKYADGPVCACEMFNEGDVFITDGQSVPKGFCVWAYQDMFKDLLLVRKNATCLGKDGKCQVVSCTDGMRPVVFLVEPHELED